ncbi:TRAP transporter large permease [Megalodesulfovibrio gigas]|uniref:Putative TRAP transporter, DctM subunit n=1 Tax=Megalodesulfovibrio gigas (strain ATCC 19364 / DSM 1382 / NCIMB 9332 / VKM B-1759) TaxID=1121448 RepID=T2GCH6_MEGG1|nr:TRAP transporter large permease [Megalodesulfovibrio gigas]AGW13587.1 putative TRAP transporter, DctM subunit [Megalodesulfovibrio gigas DSM 1382 = ATCC 19364]
MSLMALGLFLGLLLLGVPIVVAMGAAGVAALLWGGYPLELLVERLHGGASMQALLAVPLFMIMGRVMEAGGMLTRLMDVSLAALGRGRMGVCLACVLASMLFAGVSGSAAADVTAVGALFIPAMLRRGMPPARAAALQAAGGSMGIVIPPSIPMIVYSAVTGVSVGRLFTAGLLPGLLMAVALAAVAWMQERRAVAAAGAVDVVDEPAPAFGPALRRAALVAPAPVLVVGSILLGMATATEAAALGLGYVVLAGLLGTRELRPAMLPGCFMDAGIAAARVLCIIAAATPLTWILAMDQAPARIGVLLADMAGSPLVLLLVINLVLLLAGAILETTSCLLLFVPLLAPLARLAGLAPEQMGVMVVMNLAIGMLTPPMGVCLMLSSAMAGQGMGASSRAALVHVAALLAVLALVALWPPLTTWLPSYLFS